jgi:hypothetical protein
VDVVLPGTLDVVINDLSGSSGMIKSEIAPAESEQRQNQSQNPNVKFRFLDSLLCIEGVTVATMHPESIACTILIDSKDASAGQRRHLTSAKAPEDYDETRLRTHLCDSILRGHSSSNRHIPLLRIVDATSSS